MLRELYVKNIALIDELHLCFEEGLTCLSGETGSGKSIIIDALSFVLGERADKGLIKHGEETAFVQAVFETRHCYKITAILGEGYCDDGQPFIISRSMSVSGRSEIRINGKQATLAMLRSITGLLVDIFGQSEHLGLMKQENHLKIIDGYKTDDVLFSMAEEEYRRYQCIKKELLRFGGSESERARTIDLLEYQINEITAAELSIGEDEELNSRRLAILNSEKIKNYATDAFEALAGDNSAVDAVSRSVSSWKQILRFDTDADKLLDRLEAIKYELSDIAGEIEGYIEGLDFSPYELETIEQRLDLIKTLKRKYGATIEEVLAYAEKASKELAEFTSAAAEIERLTAEKQECLERCYDVATNISAFRRQSAMDFCAEIEGELKDLGMKNAVFTVEFAQNPTLEQYEGHVSARGFDSVEFYMSANKGEPVKPLIKVISGGEMSRLMLAVKSITSRIEGIDTMVFDEVDTGISGAMALAVAKKLKALSKGCQVMVITHLPQLAALSDTNYLIFKSVENERTVTHVKKLSYEQKVDEVARLSGGDGKYAELHAKELIESVNE